MLGRWQSEPDRDGPTQEDRDTQGPTSGALFLVEAAALSPESQSPDPTTSEATPLHGPLLPYLISGDGYISLSSPKDNDRWTKIN